MKNWLAKTKEYNHIPIKEIGNGTLASGVFLGAYFLGGFTLGVSALLGGASYVAYRLLFGTDLSRDELWKGLDELAAKKAIRKLTVARRQMTKIREINDKIPAEDISGKLERLEKIGKKIITLFERDPSDIERSKRFIEVYLKGSVSVSEKFADLHQHIDDSDVHEQYHEFLDEMISAFKKQHNALLDDDVLDLDVEIEVLRRRMKTEAYNQ
jgi:5-bromo-4-chloroindolyl phosphate hydrolysis protein